MNTSAILHRLADLGITATLDGETLVLTPGAKVPEDLVPHVREHKAAIIERIQSQDAALGMWPDLGTCRACLCDTIILLSLKAQCAKCAGKVCSTCTGCITTGLIWRREAGVMPKVDGSLPELLHRLQVGSRWLTERDDELLRTGQKYCDKFMQLLDLWYSLDAGLRAVHDYEHCVFGEGQACPVNSVVTCSPCTSRKERE